MCMVMINHALGQKMNVTTLAAGMLDIVDMINKENGYGDRVYKTAQEMASTALVLLEPHHIVEHQAMSVPSEMADLYKTFMDNAAHHHVRKNP